MKKVIGNSLLIFAIAFLFFPICMDGFTTIEYIGNNNYVYETIDYNDIRIYNKIFGDIKDFYISNPVLENKGENIINITVEPMFSYDFDIMAIGIKDFNIEMKDKIYNIGDKFNENDLMVSIVYEDNTTLPYKPEDIEILIGDNIIQKYNIVICRYHDVVAMTVFEGE